MLFYKLALVKHFSKRWFGWVIVFCQNDADDVFNFKSFKSNTANMIYNGNCLLRQIKAIVSPFGLILAGLAILVSYGLQIP